ncbi:hypothetical protein ACFWAO_35300, partial [Streptomyces sp. NPDC059981]|uniref:hypothetical protein n=1 Tax=Streptomyces sp. NPDC059981 TaxID=3347023 RepID=UPI00369FCA67
DVLGDRVGQGRVAVAVRGARTLEARTDDVPLGRIPVRGLPLPVLRLPAVRLLLRLLLRLLPVRLLRLRVLPVLLRLLLLLPVLLLLRWLLLPVRGLVRRRVAVPRAAPRPAGPRRRLRRVPGVLLRPCRIRRPGPGDAPLSALRRHRCSSAFSDFP